jgi:uncharacterized protein (DUF1778 family)
VSTKSHQLQIRVSPQEKSAIQRLAKRAGQSVSRYVLSRVLPDRQVEFAEILEDLREEHEWRFALARLHDFVAGLGSRELEASVAEADLSGLSRLRANYVAAMVEQAANLARIDPPAWTRDVVPLEEPHFAVPYRSLRAHLLREAPVAFKRRNIFVDSTIGDRA